MTGKKIITPFLPRDSVYAVLDCQDIIMHVDNVYKNSTGASNCPFESQCEREDCDQGFPIVVKANVDCVIIDEHEVRFSLYDVKGDYSSHDVGRKIFLTEEEARESLR